LHGKARNGRNQAKYFNVCDLSFGWNPVEYGPLEEVPGTFGDTTTSAQPGTPSDRIIDQALKVIHCTPIDYGAQVHFLTDRVTEYHLRHSLTECFNEGVSNPSWTQMRLAVSVHSMA
jgi:hypothetical protein